jgi:hypothetical protein
MSTGSFVRSAVLSAAIAAIANAAWAEDFPAPVEAWRSRIEAKAEDTGIPIDFLLKWCRSESGGNPCSLGIPNREAGIAQTYHPDDRQVRGDVRRAARRLWFRASRRWRDRSRTTRRTNRSTRWSTS